MLLRTTVSVAVLLAACGGTVTEAACPVHGDPYQQPCANEGATCAGTTACSITPVQTFVCQSGGWVFVHGSPDNCGDVVDSGKDANCPSVCNDEPLGTTCPAGSEFCIYVDPPPGCDPPSRGCCSNPGFGLRCGDGG